MTTEKPAVEAELGLQGVGFGSWTTPGEPAQEEKPGTVWNYSGAQVSLPDSVAILGGVRPLPECPGGIAATHHGKPYWLVGRFSVDGMMYSLLIPRELKEHTWEEVDPSVERIHFKDATLRVFVCSKCGRRNLEEQIPYGGGCSEVGILRYL